MARSKRQKDAPKPTWLARISRWLLVSVCCVVVVAGAIDLLNYIFKSDVFVVKNYEILGTSLLDTNEVLHQLDIPSLVRIWELDPEVLEARLVDLPLVESVQIRRVLPQSLVIQVEERQPIARIKDTHTNTMFVLDTNAVVLGETRELQQRAEQQGVELVVERLPIVEGLRGWGWVAGDRIVAQDIDRLLKALGVAVTKNEKWLADMHTIQYNALTKEWVLSANLLGEIRIGNRSFMTRIGQLGPVYRLLAGQSLAVHYTDLRFEEQGVVVKPVQCDPCCWTDLARQNFRQRGLTDAV